MNIYIHTYICRFPVCFLTLNRPLSFRSSVVGGESVLCARLNLYHVRASACVINGIQPVLRAGSTLCYAQELVCVVFRTSSLRSEHAPLRSV